MVLLCALFSSFCFDFFVRSRGATNLSYGVLDAVPAPGPRVLKEAGVLETAAGILCQSPLLAELWRMAGLADRPPALSAAAIADERARLDALIAASYGVSLAQYAAVLSTFPNLDRSQPMLPGEPKCFMTRDLTLRAFCAVTGADRPDVGALMGEIGSGLSDPKPEYRDLDTRIDAYGRLGAVSFRPTPRGARTPTDPALLEDVARVLSGDPLTADDIAEALGEDQDAIVKVLKMLKKAGDAYVEGRGKHARYYVIEDD